MQLNKEPYWMEKVSQVFNAEVLLTHQSLGASYVPISLGDDESNNC